MWFQNTVKKDVTFSGIGIHTGKEIQLRLLPSEAGDVVFKRMDLNDRAGRVFPINPQAVVARSSSVLKAGEHRIQTIEHLMAVLFVFGIDSVVVELDGEEVPIMDGSALPFVEEIQRVGIKTISQKRKIIKIVKTFVVRENGAVITCRPDDDFKISYSIHFDHPAIKTQKLSLIIDTESFTREIAPARTFGFLKDVPAMLQQNLAQGGSLENALVLDESGVINGPLRFPDEFVRHKILDLIGDLALLRYHVIGHFEAKRAGHQLHLQTARYLWENPQFWIFP